MKNKNGFRLALAITSLLLFIASISSIFLLAISESYVKEKSEVQEVVLKRYLTIDAYNILGAYHDYQITPKSNLIYVKYINDEVVESLNENEDALFKPLNFQDHYSDQDDKLNLLKLEISLRKDLPFNDKYKRLNFIVDKLYDLKFWFFPLALISLFISIYSMYNFLANRVSKESKIPIEIIGIIMISSLFTFDYLLDDIGLLLSIFIGLYLFGLIINQIKRRALIKQSLTYRIIKRFSENLSLFYKLLLVFAIFGIIQLVLFVNLENSYISIIFIANILLFIFVFYHLRDIEKLNDATSRIVDGELDLKIENNSKFNLFETIILNLNKLSDATKKAFQKEMQSELMKTELITNVSHDIKTPITSIINYVDLLQKSDNDDEKAKYLEVLNRQSQKLKNLVENLIEISKLTTGNISLNKEELELNLLLRQMVSEYEEKFSENHLEVDLNLNENMSSIYVDGNQVSRVFDNLFENILLYAQENTRIYISSNEKDSTQIIEIKNISKDKLNIKPEELLERFVREDISRHTEGSGLGLSIAESIIKLHDGTFNLDIDGDLLKVTITLK